MRITGRQLCLSLVGHHNRCPTAGCNIGRDITSHVLLCDVANARDLLQDFKRLPLHKVDKSKAIPATGREGLWGCIHSRLTDGGKAVSSTHWPRSTHQKHFSVSGTHLC
jgi:hypothetical protein